MNYDYVIYCDLDGVLAAFEEKCQIILNGTFNTFHKSKIWSGIQHYNDNVEPFFESLEKMHDADILMDFIKSNFGNIRILSACGFTPKDAGDQKRRWCEKHYGKELIVKIVSKSPDKAQYAASNAILIDDRNKSIDPWIQAGGIGILHKNAEETIKELSNYIRMENI